MQFAISDRVSEKGPRLRKGTLSSEAANVLSDSGEEFSLSEDELGTEWEDL